MSKSGYVHVEFEQILQETDAAFLITIQDEDVWLPKSQIANPEDYTEGDAGGTISITEWIANEKGIEE